MKCRVKRLTLIVCLLMMIASLTAGIVACGPKSKASTYYLSLQSEFWQTYDSEKDVPDKVRFEKDASDENVYTLEIELDEGEQFTINKVGSTDKIGFEALFSMDEELVRSENGSFEVTKEGKYTLRLDTKTNTVTYTFGVEKEIISININAPATSIYVGDIYSFTLTANWSDNSQSTISDATWTSSNESVATVSAQGVVSAVWAGTSVIKAVTGTFEDTVEITVIQPRVPVAGVELDKTELLLDRGEIEKLNATVLPENADNKMVTWDSENKSVVTVTEDGTVTAVGYGTTTVTVTTANGGKTASCLVTVVQHVSSIKLNSTKLTVVANGVAKAVSVEFQPSGATFKTFTYEVTEGSELIAISAEDGGLSVRGLAEGKATIVFASTDNPDATAVCEVEVLAENSVWAELPQNKRIMLEDSAILSVQFDGLVESDVETVEWAVANSAVATIVGNGISATVTGMQFGSTVVTATVTDKEGNVYTATCNVLVADEFFFIYGYGLGSGDWAYQEYVSDENAARDAELLLEEQSTGLYALTRYLTPNNGFQIIFPNVASYTDDDGVWNKNMPAANVAVTEYYDSSRSDSALISNVSDQFKVNAAGVYTIYLDLTGTSAKVYIKNVSVDVTSVKLDIKSGSALLRNGESVTLSIAYAPSRATFTEDDVKLVLSSLYAAYADYVSYEFDFNNMTVTLTVKADPTTDFSLTVRVAIGEIQGEIELIIFPASKQETPVTSIAFEEVEYFVNVNNGGKAWEIELKAAVNLDATVQGVKYTVNSSNFTIDADTGLLSSTRLGTVTVTAIAIGDESKTATCTVTFYSDTFYLSGEFNDSTAFDSLSQDTTSIAGTAFEKYAFTMVSPTYFMLEVTLEQYKQIGNRDEYGFQIIHLGINEQWSSALTVSMRNVAGCYNADTYFSIHDRNMRVLVTGTYFIEIDLSGTSARWTINWKETTLQEILLTPANTELKEGETTQVELAFGPSFAARPESEVEWTITSGSSYIEINFDYATLTATVKVISSEFSEDATATVTCTVGTLTKSVTFTIIAQHHLEWTWDDEAHFWACTDEGCDYTGERAAHKKTSGYVTNDPRGHYSSCEDCGIEFGFEAHSHAHSDDYVATGSEVCDVCGFEFFQYNGNTLLRCYYDFERVNLSASSITALGESAFEGNVNLKEITLPNPIQTGLTIGDKAFKDCISLTAISLPNAVTSIGSYAFTGTAVEITWGRNPRITEFRQYAFYGYLGTSITIPSTVINLGASAFAYSNLTSIVIPDTVMNTSTTLNAGSHLFEGCASLRTVVIGKGLTMLKSSTFRDCVALETVIIKSSGFYQVAVSAFRNCNSIKAVYIERELKQLLTCTWLFMDDNSALIGHVYAYSSSDPGENPDYGTLFPEYFAGTWHYDDSGIQSLDHLLLWNEEPTSLSMPVIIDDKRNLATDVI